MKTATIADGVYFLHPEGSGWIAAKFRGGKLVAMTDEANADTHATANDRWAGVVPSEDDTECSVEEATAIVREVDERMDPTMVVVCRAAESL